MLPRGAVDETRRRLSEPPAIRAGAYPRHRDRVGAARWLAAALLLAGDRAATEALVREYADDLSMCKVEPLAEQIRRGWR